MKVKFFNYILSAVLISATNVAAAAVWDKKFYDPKDIEGTVVLPMPCDGAMAFRVVKTDTRAPLEDKPVVLGSDGGEQGFSEHSTPNHIAGSFAEKSGERYFLMGKYEVSRLQYQAVMDENCPTADMKGRLPVTEVSWFDAVAFTHKYNEWLLKNHKDKLPQEDGRQGFIRLPTNVEWEYATRGGAAVSDSEFREKTFPIAEGLAKAVWFSGSKSANGRLQLTGLLAPNPIGLFDVLGNVNEMTFDSFKMNKLDRYHGQSGGITVRGGSYLTPEDQISSSFRIESPYYTEVGQVFKAKDTGFRVVLVTPVITSNNRLKELNEAWKLLGKDSNNKDQEIVSNLEKITQSVENKDLKEQLKKLEDSLRASNQAKDEQRDHAIRSALQLGAFLCTDVSDLNKTYENNKNIYDKLCSNKETAMDSCPNLKEKTDESLNVRDFVLKYYADTLVETASTYAQNTVKNQVQAVLDKLKNQNKSNLNQYVDLYWKHLASYYKNGKVERENWLKACNSVRVN